MASNSKATGWNSLHCVVASSLVMRPVGCRLFREGSLPAVWRLVRFFSLRFASRFLRSWSFWGAGASSREIWLKVQAWVCIQSTRNSTHNSLFRIRVPLSALPPNSATPSPGKTTSASPASISPPAASALPSPSPSPGLATRTLFASSMISSTDCVKPGANAPWRWFASQVGQSCQT